MKHSSFALIPLLLLPACKMPENLIDDPNYTPTYTWGNEDKQDDIEKVQELVAPAPPVIEALPSLYYYDTIPVRGKAAAGADVLVSSSEKGVVAGMVDSNGSFCVDLPLARNKTQAIKVRIHNGLFSDYASTTIAQQYFGPEEEPPVTVDPNDPYAQPKEQFTLDNIAEGKTVHINDADDLKTGFLNYLTDGLTTEDNKNNYADLLDPAFNRSAWVWVDLQEIHEIYMVEVVLNPDGVDGYPGEIKVYTTTATEAPELSENGWDVSEKGDSLQGSYPAANSSENIVSSLVPIVLYNKPQARQVGFQINFKGNVLNRWASISELRIYERNAITDDDHGDDINPVEGLVTPTCSNGKKL